MSSPTQIELLDTFTHCIIKSLQTFGIEYPPHILYGTLGIGSRFSLAMNVKTGKEIGHPSTEYIWDIISFIEYCFIELGIKCLIYIDGGYLTSARSTSADGYSRPDFVVSLDKLRTISGPLMYPTEHGKWVFEEEVLTVESYSSENLPFGRIIIKITMVDDQIDQEKFPINTLGYVIRTFERGEEPMEIVGKGDYSALSGWKAFARWMQAYSLPMKSIRHDNLVFLGRQLHLRRHYYSKYWEHLAKHNQNPKEAEFSEKLAVCYRNITDFAKMIVSDGQNFQNIKEIYYLEQKTLPIYKEIKYYLTSL